MQWDPEQYGRYADERARPFLDLLARVECPQPRRVVDLGCGPGNLTEILARRWPQARVEGIDASPEMIAAARPRATARLGFRLADVTSWTVPADADVIISNAALQWVPTHRQLLTRWAQAAPPGGWLAFQVPDQLASPSHRLMRELAESPRWADQLRGVLRNDDSVARPEEYAALLLDAGLAAEVWTTTYLHILPGPDPVLDWLRGTGLRPVLAALDPEEATEFEAQFGARLRLAYPTTEHGTMLPYQRTFAVGHR